MELPDFVQMASRPDPLRFLVIGGHAVAAHGYNRATFDVDLLGRQADREKWKARAAEAQLTMASEMSAFIQFDQADGDGLDIMFVNESTFENLWKDSEERDFGGQKARVPSLDHLIALKLHVLKQGLRHRTMKDADDVETLARRNGLDFTLPKYEELFLKFGNREIYETFLRIMRP